MVLWVFLFGIIIIVFLQVISGSDPHDSTSVPKPVPDFAGALRRDIKGLRIGLPKEYFIPGLDPEVEKADNLRV